MCSEFNCALVFKYAVFSVDILAASLLRIQVERLTNGESNVPWVSE